MTETLEAEALLRARFFFHRYRFAVDIARQAQLQLDRAAAPGFIMCDYMWLDESRISNIIKELLNPRGSHGQQTLFLELFLNRVNQQLPEIDQLDLSCLEKTRVALEVVTHRIENSQRRIDIVLSNPLWAVGIENKPWAALQSKQLEDYKSHLEKAYAGRPVHMVYLPGDCSPPTTDTTGNTTAIIGYNWHEDRCGSSSACCHLTDWLEESRNKCQADKVCRFLADFARWIRCNFNHHSHKTGHQGG